MPHKKTWQKCASKLYKLMGMRPTDTSTNDVNVSELMGSQHTCLGPTTSASTNTVLSISVSTSSVNTITVPTITVHTIPDQPISLPVVLVPTILV